MSVRPRERCELDKLRAALPGKYSQGLLCLHHKRKIVISSLAIFCIVLNAARMSAVGHCVLTYRDSCDKELAYKNICLYI